MLKTIPAHIGHHKNAGYEPFNAPTKYFHLIAISVIINIIIKIQLNIKIQLIINSFREYLDPSLNQV
jgi:hypothetical protein